MPRHSARRRLWAANSRRGTASWSTLCGCSCSPASTSGAPAPATPPPRRTDALAEIGGASRAPLLSGGAGAHEHEAAMSDERTYPLVSPLVAGLTCRCPRCGKGKLFDGFLSLPPRCNVGGLDYSFIDAGAGQ